MTDRDKSPEGFLQRWSRKKTEAEREMPVAAAEAVESRAPPSEEAASPASPNAQMPSAPSPGTEFDLTTLPSLDSITATSDIRAFLMPGVPKELARAALRRAWSADPAIRDFVGLAENAWDFTDPNATAGFGPLPPGFDVKKLLAELFGEERRPQLVSNAVAAPQELQTFASVEQITRPSSDETLGRQHETSPKVEPVALDTGEAPFVDTGEAPFVQRDNNIALQRSDPEDDRAEPKKPRQHGGALPQ